MLSQKPSTIAIFITFICFFIPLSYCSLGDDLDEFNDCRFRCEQTACQEGGKEKLRLGLRLLFWDCKQNCDYQCQQIVAEIRYQNSLEIYQFHGKWPFRRILGSQEFVSAIFSVGNFAVHVRGFQKIVNKVNVHKSPVRGHYVMLLFSCGITILAWLFSTIFHIRDFPITETLDYYFAGLTMMVGFYLIIARYFRLYLPQRKLAKTVFTGLCTIMYTCHIIRLVHNWLYTYNTQVHLALAAFQYIFWALLCFSLYSLYSFKEKENSIYFKPRNYLQLSHTLFPDFFCSSCKRLSLYPLFLCFLMSLGMSMEIWDFPPVFSLVDAHSVWHFATIIPFYCGWYDWFIWDIEENVVSDIHNSYQKRFKKVK